MRRKSGHIIVDVDGKVTVVHLNVGAGYLTYLEGTDGKRKPKVKGVSLEGAR